MKYSASSIIGWTAAILVAAMNIMSGVMKFIMTEATPGVEAAMQAGFWDIRYELGALQLIITALFLIPRTSTVGFVLMVGYLGGALAANLTHAMYADAVPVYIAFVLITICGWFRHPELTARLLGKPYQVA